MDRILTLLVVSLVICCKLEPKQESKILYDHSLIAEDNMLTIKYSGKADVVQFKMFEGLYTILNKHDDNTFSSHIEIPNLDDAIFSYNFIIHEMDSLKKMHQIDYYPQDTDDKQFLWIGSKRTANHSKSSTWKSRMIYDTLSSEYLSEPREVTIYKSEGPDDKKPIIYCTDGNIVESYAPYIDELINQKKIMPIDLIGVHSSQINRYQEYVEDDSYSDDFYNHRHFFLDEVKNTYEKKNAIRNRYIYGFSNGAAFAMYCGINYPEDFTEVIAFSTADYVSEYSRPVEFKFENYPTFYLGAGKYEESIYRSNLNFLYKLEANNVEAEFKTFISGHDYNVWRIEFLKYLEATFRR